MRQAGIFVAVLALVVGLFVAPWTAADGAGASARVQPPSAPPGTVVHLVYTVASPALAEVVVQGHIRCQVTGLGNLVATPCARDEDLVEANAVGSDSRDYVFDYELPPGDGSYNVTFHLDSTLTLLPTDYTATASFKAVTPASSGGGGGGGGGSGGGGNGGGGGSGGGNGGGGGGGGSGGGTPTGTTAPTGTAGQTGGNNPNGGTTGDPVRGHGATVREGGTGLNDLVRYGVSTSVGVSVLLFALIAGHRRSGGFP